MQKGDFRIDADPDRALLRMTLSGFFGEDDIRRFLAERDAALRMLRCAPNQHVTLVDIRDMQIQSQELVSRFQQVLGDPRCAARRIAFVISKSLARLQLQRAAEGRGARYFTSSAEAEAWLETSSAATVPIARMSAARHPPQPGPT